ncbi:MAG TPA: hypothetical protein VKE51_30785 [Vicinamibacterales bacterium]|nr:hypothetical protein [Vicinamibacterales bacterium]
MNDRTDFTDGTIIDQRYRQAVQALGTINELASARHRSPSAEKAEAADLLDEAQRLFEATLYNDAWKKYRQVLAMQPADKRAIIGLDQVEAIFEREQVARRKKDRLLLILAVVFATLVSIIRGLVSAHL